MRRFSALALAVFAAGCVAAPAAQQRPEPVAARPAANQPGLEGVIGQNARALTALFGQPGQDVREFNARKLQFASGACVLDTYLYARRKGQEPVVTHVDARLPDGRDTDRAACVAALSRRR